MTPVFGSPWSSGLGADKTNGIGQLTTLRELVQGASIAGLVTIGMQKQFEALPVPDRTTSSSEDLAARR